MQLALNKVYILENEIHIHLFHEFNESVFNSTATNFGITTAAKPAEEAQQCKKLPMSILTGKLENLVQKQDKQNSPGDSIFTYK